MQSTSSDKIVVTATAEGVRYRLPVRPRLAVIGMVYTAAGVVAPLAVLTWGIGAFQQPELAPALIQSAFSLAALPLAVLPLFYGLWMWIGHDDVEVTQGLLKSMRSVRGFGRQRIRTAARIFRLSIVCLRSKGRDPSCTLYAELDQGVPFIVASGYSQELLTALANELAKRCPEHLQRSGPLPVATVDLSAIKVYYWGQGYAKAALMGAGMCIVGLVLVAIGAPEWASDQATRGWPTAMGRITASEVVKSERKEDGKLVEYFRAKVTYRYEVSGESFESDRLHYGVDSQEHTKRRFVDHIVDRYPLGQAVTVYYSPRSPRTAVLEPGGGTLGAASVTLLGACLLLAGLPAVLYYAWRVSSPRNHILYQGDLKHHAHQPSGVGAALANRLSSDLTAVVFIAVPLMLVVAVVVTGLAIVFLR